MKKIFTLFVSIISTTIFAQISGIVSDVNGETLPAVSIYIEGTYNGTSSNENGVYELNVNKPGKYTVVFQYLGYRTQKVTREINSFPHSLNVKLEEEKLEITEIQINTKENPANGIIRKAIAARKSNEDKVKRYTADFYSRGINKLKDMPKKFMGIEVGDMDGHLDSTRSGIIYLSETVSKLKFEKPNNLSETIIASKISGDDKGYSYNTARGANFEFYSGTLNFGVKMISPIADNAFNYYQYKLEGTFIDDYNHTINKIKIIPRRDSEPVFDGFIYIIDDTWQIYAIDVTTKGYRAKIEMLTTFSIQQNYVYNKKENQWAKHTQFLEVDAGVFGIKFFGKFTHVFSNYDFVDEFEDKTFTKEIVKIEKDSNKKDSIFWNEFRAIPLTMEESRDYVRKDSIYEVRNSEKYLDSIDAKHNRFNLFDVVSGYSYRNSKNKTRFEYEGLLTLSSVNFNTVQGWNLSSGFNFNKTHNDFGKITKVDLKFNYGFSDERLRYYLEYYHRFNMQNYNTLRIASGVKTSQFNASEPISKFINTMSSLLFANNFMKLYNKEFVDISYSQIAGNNVSLLGSLKLERRKPLLDQTDFKWVKTSDEYFSNNPLDPDDFTSTPFEKHRLAKFEIKSKFYFGTKYITRPDAKILTSNSKYPVLSLNAVSAFAGSKKEYEFQKIEGGLQYNLDLSNKGNLKFNGKAGKFFNAENITFIDYHHFNGNQTHVNTDENYLNVFNFLPYYSLSTNKSFGEAHFEYYDNGFIINKIPLLNLTRGNLVVGFHNLATQDRKPYQEFTIGLDRIGFGKFKFFRIDYIRSYQNGFVGDGVIFGAKILNFLD